MKPNPRSPKYSHIPITRIVPLAIAAFAGNQLLQASSDYGPAIWNPPCNANYYTTGYGHKFHVCHDMEGYYLASISMFDGCGWTASSVHYAVNGLQDTSTDHPAGEITQMISDANYAWHVCCWNQYCTGTEHEGFASNPAWYSEAMYEASAGISRHEAQKFGYPIDRNHIVGHNEWQNAAWRGYAGSAFGISTTCNTHTDPGAYWDWSHYMALVGGSHGAVNSDWDGDRIADAGIFRPSNGAWYIKVGSGWTTYWGGGPGQTNDIPCSADYTGDGKMDYAVYRPSTGTWYIEPNGGGASWTVGWGGNPGDVPVPGDYDGDGIADAAIYRPSNGAWYVKVGSGYTVYWGGGTGHTDDIAVPADYTGDGKMDYAVYRPSTGTWYIQPNGGGSSWTVAWGGNPGDIPVPADYDGDGKADAAIFRPSTGAWYIKPSGGGASYTVYWGGGTGNTNDIPIPTDYTGDGKADFAVYRPSTGTWYIEPNGGGSSWSLGWGGSVGDVPTPMSPALYYLYFASAAPKVDVTVDNSDAGFSASANWSTGTSATDKYGADYRYHTTAATSDAASWTANLANSGTYTISAWWSQGANRSTNAPYVITDSSGTQHTVNMNQQINGGTWNSLGTYTLNAGNNTVSLSCWTSTGYIVVADAIRFQQQ